MKKARLWTMVLVVATVVFLACPPPAAFTASFVWAPAFVAPGQLVTFTSSGKGHPATWRWDFGDGTDMEEGSSVMHAFSLPGKFPVTLSVMNEAEVQKSVTKTITVLTSLVADFVWDSFVEAETPLQFTDQSTGNPTSWAWTFGDGGTSTARNPVHTFATAGNFNVTLTITNAGGSKTIAHGLVVEVAMRVDFLWTPDRPVGGQEVQFTDKSTGVGIISWLWDFGDGTTSTLQNPKHTYTNVSGADKQFVVSLTVTNEHGDSASMALRPDGTRTFTRGVKI